MGIAGTPATIPFQIISLGIIKVLFCCAKREGLYIPHSVRKEYVPLIIQNKKEKTPIPQYREALVKPSHSFTGKTKIS